MVKNSQICQKCKKNKMVKIGKNDQNGKKWQK